MRFYTFACISALGIAACALMIIFGVASFSVPGCLLLAVMLSVCAASAVVCVRAYSRLKLARLISGNAILHIRNAEISSGAGAAAQTNADDIEVFVSYFGILMGSKIVKFNQDGIRLRAVEFGPDYIMLTYGTDNSMQSTRLLRPAVPRDKLSAIAGKFRYETGIEPVIHT